MVKSHTQCSALGVEANWSVCQQPEGREQKINVTYKSQDLNLEQLGILNLSVFHFSERRSQMPRLEWRNAFFFIKRVMQSMSWSMVFFRDLIGAKLLFTVSYNYTEIHAVIRCRKQLSVLATYTVERLNFNRIYNLTFFCFDRKNNYCDYSEHFVKMEQDDSGVTVRTNVFLASPVRFSMINENPFPMTSQNLAPTKSV